MNNPNEQMFTNSDLQDKSSLRTFSEHQERRVSSLLPISSAVVSHPFVKETMFNNYVIYKVSFRFNDAEQEVNRRFSDFDSLRKAIRLYRPFNYIYPVHRKQFIVFSTGDSQSGVRQGPFAGTEQLSHFHPKQTRNVQHRYAQQTLSMTSLIQVSSLAK